jgi:hypothetical protein
MDPEIAAQLARMEAEMKEIFISVEQTRKYFLWTMIATAVLFVLPLVGLLFAVPAFLSSYSGSLETMSGLM